MSKVRKKKYTIDKHIGATGTGYGLYGMETCNGRIEP